VLCYTKGGGSSTESLINLFKSKHIIYESEDHKIVLAQEEIRSQIVMKEIGLLEATKRDLITLKTCTMLYLQATPHRWNQRGLFQPRYFLSQNLETD